MKILVTASEIAEMDRRTIKDYGVPGRVLMEVAGRAVAEACRARLAAGQSVTVVCGTGNNGGDGFVTARALAALGYDVEVFVAGEPDKAKADAGAALDAAEDALEVLGLVEPVAGVEGLGGEVSVAVQTAVALDAGGYALLSQEEAGLLEGPTPSRGMEWAIGIRTEGRHGGLHAALTVQLPC